MKNIINICNILIFLVACESKKIGVKNETETPKSLQEIQTKSDYSKRSNNLINDLYNELVEKTPELQTIEENIAKLETEASKRSQEFNKYDENSTKYYDSYKILMISDSALKRKMNLIIQQSKEKYINQTAELTSLLKQIDDNKITIQDYHNILKIMITLPIIEKYQNENKPKIKEFYEVIK